MLSLIILVLIFGLGASLLSLIGGLLLLVNEAKARRWSLWLVSFAAGALLGVAFLDVLPEAAEMFQEAALGASLMPIFFAALAGLVLFFTIERVFLWFHHHEERLERKHTHPEAVLIIYGDAVHNFIDGVVVGTAFLTAVPLGIATALAIAAHEIPQEIGDFGVLLHAGYSKIKNLIVNMLASLTTPVGALLTLAFAPYFTQYLPYILGFAGGIFIYIAASDLIPEIHRQGAKGRAPAQIAVLMLGIFVIWLVGQATGV